MRNKYVGLLAVVALTISAVALGTSWVGANIGRQSQLNPESVPSVVAYQGVLVDAKGNPVEDGSRPITFRIYGAAPGGSALWEETQEVTTVNGVFNVLLGAVTKFENVFESSPLYLGIQMEGDEEMRPRQALASVPFALQAGNADTLDGLDSTAFALDDHPHEGSAVLVLQTDAKGETTVRVESTCPPRATAPLAPADGGTTAEATATPSGGLGGIITADRYFTSYGLAVKINRGGADSVASPAWTDVAGGTALFGPPPEATDGTAEKSASLCSYAALTLVRRVVVPPELVAPSTDPRAQRQKLFTDAFVVTVDGLANLNRDIFAITIEDVLFADRSVRMLLRSRVRSGVVHGEGYRWFADAAGGTAAPKSISIAVLLQDGVTEAARYDFDGCIPATWSLETPVTNRGGLQSETLVVECDRVSMTSGDLNLTGFVQAIMAADIRFRSDIVVSHLDQVGTVTESISYLDAFPTKFVFPSFNAQEEDAELQEEISFVPTGLRLSEQ